jgi:DNA-directed RNA polymerase subunit RPC12/RpoP
MASATLRAPTERPGPVSKPESRRTYSCPECEHVLRVFGGGRHRVYFETDNKRLDDPVMNRVCPACGHGLLGKNRP